MSRFFSQKYTALTPYVPGEQPQERQYIKLNTNESPFPPSPKVVELAKSEAGQLNRYCDPDASALTRAVAAHCGVSPAQVLMTNGSDDILNFAFMAYGDAQHPFAFPDISYGFYEVFCQVHQIPYTMIPLNEDFTINPDAFCGIGKNIAIANPNAPTGLALRLEDIEKIVSSNPDNIVIIDEAYVDFGGDSALTLLSKYENLLVTRTFSKSYSLAGARLGFGVGSEAIISDLNTIKFSTNPYNVNRMTAAAGLAALEENDYYMENVRTICAVRDETAKRLRNMGCLLTDSKTNFLFVEVPGLSGETLCAKLRENGILVRHWNKPRIQNRCRITVGTKEEMDALVKALEEIV